MLTRDSIRDSDHREEEDDGAVPGDTLVALVAKCPLKELPGYEAVLAKLGWQHSDTLSAGGCREGKKRCCNMLK